MKTVVSLLSLILMIASFAHSEEYYPIPRNQLYIGPEIYHISRKKEGGSSQTGNLGGFRLGYERIKRFNFYLGADLLMAKGQLEGKTAHKKIHSTFTDINLEERFGYTIESKCWLQPSITPFIGGGNFWERNHYKHPSPLKIHFDNNFTYATAGFISRLRILPDWTVGLNFKIRYIVKSHVKISHDPDADDHTINYEEKIQYRVELPVNYYLCLCSQECAIGVVPFYEYRPYGHRANFPFDFLETNYKLYGATVKFIYLF